jgi:hypothetical protein
VEVVDKDLVIFDPKEEEDFFFHHGKKLAYRDINKKMPKNLQFNFDQVFSPEESTGDVYYKSIQTLISSLMGGYNCSGLFFLPRFISVIIFSSSQCSFCLRSHRRRKNPHHAWYSQRARSHSPSNAGALRHAAAREFGRRCCSLLFRNLQ